jgi:hypothetical protein
MLATAIAVLLAQTARAAQRFATSSPTSAVDD